MTDKPQVVIPRGQVSKFVQLVVDGKDYLRARESYFSHKDILEEALREFKISFGWENIGGDLPGWEIFVPARKGERYEAIGMGHCRVAIDNRIDFFGESLDYRLKPNKEQIGRLIEQGVMQGVEFYDR